MVCKHQNIYIWRILHFDIVTTHDIIASSKWSISRVIGIIYGIHLNWSQIEIFLNCIKFINDSLFLFLWAVTVSSKWYCTVAYQSQTRSPLLTSVTSLILYIHCPFNSQFIYVSKPGFLIRQVFWELWMISIVMKVLKK